MGSRATAAVIDDPVTPDPLPEEVIADPQQKSLYDRLTEVDQTTENPVARFFSNAGAAAIKTPENIWNTVTDLPGTVKGMAESVGDAADFWTDPNTYTGNKMKAIANVAPEALGQATGMVAGGEATAPLVKPAGRLAKQVASKSKDAAGFVGRNEFNELRPSVKLASRVGGAYAGHQLGMPGVGEFGGAFYGPEVADMVIPNRRGAFSKADRAAQPANENPNLKINKQKLADQVAAQKAAAAPPQGPKVQPWQGPLEDTTPPKGPDVKPFQGPRSGPPETPVTGPTVQPWQGPMPNPDIKSNPILTPSTAARPKVPLVKSVEEWNAHDQRQRIYGREASEKGMEHAARGSKKSLKDRVREGRDD